MQALIVLKLVTMTLFFYHALLLFAHQRHTRVGWTGTLFLFCMGCYLICTLIVGLPEYDLLRFMVLPGCIGGPFFFWLFARSLFDDNFRPGLPHWMLLAFVEVFTLFKHYRWPEALFTAIAQEPFATGMLNLFPQVISLGLVASVVFTAYAGREEDLLEGRRRLRSVFIILIGVYALAVLISEIALKNVDRAPMLLEGLHFSTLLGFNLYFGVHGLNFVQGILAAPSPKAPEKTAAENRNPEAENPELLARLTAIMEGDEIFREDGLTIRVLAARMNVQEYRLRRAINGALGFRNFSDFVNRYRVQAACEILADPAHKNLPVTRIAMDLGFGSLAPFNRAFKQLTGTTPTGYRRDALQAQGGQPDGH